MEQLEPRIVAFMRDRIDQMGEEQSGAYGFYKARTDQGVIYGAYERHIYAHLMRDRPGRIVHAGIGIGSFCAALAVAGVPCTGYEMDRLRMECAGALRDHLGLDYGLRQAFFPDGTPPQADLLLLTNVAASWNQDGEDAMIEAFRRYPRVIFSPQHFGRQRDDPAEMAGLMARVDPLEVRPVEARGYHYVEITPRKRARRKAA